MIASVQYLTIVIPFSIGRPFRKPMSTNVAFCINIVVILLLDYYIILWPAPFIVDIMKLYYGSGVHDMRQYSMLLIITMITMVYSIAAYVYEKIVVSAISRISREVKGDD